MLVQRSIVVQACTLGYKNWYVVHQTLDAYLNNTKGWIVFKTDV